MLKEEDSHYLLKALELAKIRKGFCAPNPSVGAVIIKDKEIIGRGWHETCGADHAEVMAFKSLSEEARGATLYVTLMPCCHEGRTPPCTDKIIAQKIKRVVFGFKDPNPKVASKSQQILQQANIEVVFLPLPNIDRFYQSYAFWWQHQRPFVTAKLAMSLNGKITGKEGVPVKITGKEAEMFTHKMRQQSDAILTTVKTILNDDPSLNVRLNNETIAKPVYVLDSQLELSFTAKLFTTAKNITLFYANGENEKIKALEEKQVRCIKVNEVNNNLNLTEVLNLIGQDGMQDVWVEAGGRVFAALHKADLVQRSYIYVAPCCLDEEGYSAFMGDMHWLNQAKAVKWWPLGKDGCCELEW